MNNVGQPQPPAAGTAGPPPEPAKPAAGEPPVAPVPPTAAPLTPEEQMALYEKDLQENDWGHQPC